MTLIEVIKSLLSPRKNQELSVHEKEVLSELQNENKTLLFGNK
ncbi:hypothetical protein [Companilactobacillus hulinensis]|nr:hypothetical protein [Companilactobacillus hulinensis]